MKLFQFQLKRLGLPVDEPYHPVPHSLDREGSDLVAQLSSSSYLAAPVQNPFLGSVTCLLEVLVGAMRTQWAFSQNQIYLSGIKTFIAGAIHKKKKKKLRVCATVGGLGALRAEVYFTAWCCEG